MIGTSSLSHEKLKLAIVKSSAPILKANSQAIGIRFYERLFAKAPELRHIFNQTNQERGLQQEALVYSVYAAGENIDSLQNIQGLVERIAEKHVSLGVKPEQYAVVGEALLEAIKEVLGDAATDDIMDAWNEAYHYIADLFIDLEKQKYADRSQQTGGWQGFRNFIVTEKVQETPDVMTLTLKPQDGESIPAYKAGQYVTLKVDIAGEPYTHMRQYSLCGPSGKGYYQIGVKRETGRDGNPDGIVSSYLHDHVTEEDVLPFSAPAGEFTIESEAKPLVLLSGGIGMTPVVGMLNTIAEQEPNRPVTYIHATQNSDSHAMKEQVEQLTAHANIQTYVCYDSPTDSDKTEQNYDKEGHVDLPWLQEILTYSDQAEFYCCGPAPFMKAVDDALTNWGTSDENKHYEVFNPVSVLSKA